MFNIEEFKAKGLPLGGARPSQFFVDMNPPPLLGFNTDTFRFTCKAASIPPSIVSPVEVSYFGRRVKYSGDREFPDWTVTVLNDADFAIRKMMTAWSDSMNYHIDNVMESGVWPTGYKQSATITQMRQDGEPIMTYSFYGLFPTQIDPIPVDWENINQVEMFEVTFSYDYWIAREGNNLAESSADGTAFAAPPLNNG